MLGSEGLGTGGLGSEGVRVGYSVFYFAVLV